MRAFSAFCFCFTGLYSDWSDMVGHDKNNTFIHPHLRLLYFKFWHFHERKRLSDYMFWNLKDCCIMFLEAWEDLIFIQEIWFSFYSILSIFIQLHKRFQWFYQDEYKMIWLKAEVKYLLKMFFVCYLNFIFLKAS